MICTDCAPSVPGRINPELLMRKQSTEGQESSIQRAVALWREYLLPYKGTLVWAVIGGMVAAVSSGFGIPVILQEMFPVIFDGKPLPPWAERVLLWYVSPKNLPWVTVWATAAMLPMVVVVRGLSSFINVYLLSKIGLGVLETLRLKVYRKYQDLSLAFHDRQQKGRPAEPPDAGYPVPAGRPGADCQ